MPRHRGRSGGFPRDEWLPDDPTIWREVGGDVGLDLLVGHVIETGRDKDLQLWISGNLGERAATMLTAMGLIEAVISRAGANAS